MRSWILGLTSALLIAGAATAQTLPITFKYVPQPEDDFVRILVPNDVLGWSVSPNAPTVMTFDDSLQLYRFTTEFAVGSTVEYKFHQHLTQDGSRGVWLSDPANPISNPADFNNSVLDVADPMIFELDRRVDADGRVTGVSAGVFASSAIEELTFTVKDTERDGIAFLDPESGLFVFELSQPTPSNSFFSLTVTDSNGNTITGSVGAKPIEVEDAQRPDGIVDGINYDADDPTRVTLSLFGPRKQFVHVIGDFNDWTADENSLMKRDSLRADSVHFWLEIDGLEPGKAYAFQYLVDGQIRVADPYSRLVLDPGHDALLGDVFPDLPPYPADKTDQIAGVIRTAKPDYVWQTTDYQRPPQEKLVVYELLIRDFVERHDYATLIDSLDYLERLGINAIELMPVAEFGGNADWGYEPNFVFAPDKYYGPENELKRFVDAAHSRGMAVILDVVYNHQAFEAPFSRLYSNSPFGTPGAQPSDDNPWLNPVAKHPFNVFNDVNHESPDTKIWLDRANRYWLEEFRVDGFRFDLSKGFTQTSSDNLGAWGAFDQSRIDLLTRMADQIWAFDSTAYIILEHFAVDREERILGTYGRDRGLPGMMIWNKESSAYSEGTMGYNSRGKSDFRHVYFGSGGRNWPIPNLIGYMESHDEQWLMYKNLRFGACEASPGGGSACNGASGYSTRKLPIALDRMKLAGTFFFTIPGPKMMWQFGELGYGFGPDGRDCLRPSNQEGDLGDCPPGTPARTAPKPIRWEYFEDLLRKKLYDTWSALLRLRHEHAVFHNAASTVDLNTGGPVKSIALSLEDENVAIVGNFAVASDSATAPFSQPGVWYDFFSGDSLKIGDLDTVFVLPAGGFHLFTDFRVEPAPDGLVTVANEPAAVPSSFEPTSLETYPNPTDDSVTVDYQIGRGGPVRLELFDVLGRSVRRLQDEKYVRGGKHRATFELSDLSKGVYVMVLSSANEQTSSRLVVL